MSGGNPQGIEACKPYRFVAGNPGRPPGAVGTYKRVEAACRKYGIANPIEQALKMHFDPKTPPGPKALYLQMVVDRWAPKLKAVEHTGQMKDIAQVLINIISAGDPNPNAPEQIEHTVTVNNTTLNIQQDQVVSDDVDTA